MESQHSIQANISNILSALFDAYKQGHILQLTFAQRSADDVLYAHLVFTFKPHIRNENVRALQDYLSTTYGISSYLDYADSLTLHTKLEMLFPRDFLPKSHPLYEFIDSPNYVTPPHP